MGRREGLSRLYPQCNKGAGDGMFVVRPLWNEDYVLLCEAVNVAQVQAGNPIIYSCALFTAWILFVSIIQ